MEDLGRYPLSVILSYLHETEGCSLLVCRRQWARQLLPIFRLPNKYLGGGVRVIGSLPKKKKSQNRHKFLVVPVQDATVRLNRLNTRRWKERQRRRGTKMPTHQTTDQVAVDEWNRILRLAQPSLKNENDDDADDDDDANSQKMYKEETTSHSYYPPLLQILPSKASSSSSFFLPGITTLVSYPRSGNTLLRTYLESWTGLVTGSDTRPDRSLSIALAERFDLVGEGVTNTPFVKTHWPERMGCRKFPTSRAVLLIRNPYDASDSCWNLNVTNTHTDKVTYGVYEQYGDFYSDYIGNEIEVWCRFHEFWLDCCGNSGIPILLVRYEDLIEDPHRELLRILEFSTKSSSSVLLKATMKERLDLVLRHKHGYQSTVTTTTTTQNRHGRSLKRHSQEFIKEMHQIDKNDLFKRFGYHVYDQDFPNQQPLPPMKQLLLGPTTTTAQTTKVVTSSLTINRPDGSVRPPNCPFGRNMRSWRRQRTADDTKPFPTI
jgi:hypothetical protein